jgi:Fur family ferric uptake transcriptional regulator
MPTTDALRDAIRAAGLRVTGPRLAVLSTLHEATGPMSHAEVVDALGEEATDRATVYRNLISLADAGLLSRRALSDRVWRFELVSEQPHPEHGSHPHFVCTACGDVSCLSGALVPSTEGHGGPRSLQAGRVEIEIRGVCDACTVEAPRS